MKNVNNEKNNNGNKTIIKVIPAMTTIDPVPVGSAMLST